MPMGRGSWGRGGWGGRGGWSRSWGWNPYARSRPIVVRAARPRCVWDAVRQVYVCPGTPYVWDPRIGRWALPSQYVGDPSEHRRYY